MKKTLTILAIIIVLHIGYSFTPRKEYKFTDGQAIMTHQLLTRAKQIVAQSDAVSAKEAGMFSAGADSIIRVIEKQYVDTLQIK